MPRCGLIVLLAGLAVAIAEVQASSVTTEETPVQKVIQLLDGMIAKGTEEMQNEQVQFSQYKAFCDSTTNEKQKSIADAAEKMEVLKADIGKFTAEAEALSKEIASLDVDISTWEGDIKSASRVREIEQIDYTATHKNVVESIAALDDGLNTLNGQNADVALIGRKAVTSALMQIKGQAIITPEAQSAINQFLSSQDWREADLHPKSASTAAAVPDENLAVAEEDNLAAPEAKAFESHLQGIIDLLSGLKTKFVKEKASLEDQESDSKHAFEMLRMDLTSQVEAATNTRTEKAEKKGSALQGAANAQGDLADTSTTKDDDMKYVTDLISECESKSGQFADRQAMRQEEIEAIGKAKEIMSSGAVAGASEKHLPQLVQQEATFDQATSFAQLRAVSSMSPVNQLRVAAYLKRRASQLDSRVLALLATKVSADPFKKVKKMIKDLIVKLMEEATSEAETKGFCDKEMSTNEHTRKEKTAQSETLTADIDELEASAAMLTEEITELTAAVAKLDASMAQATEIRTAEKKKNTATIKDAQDAQTAVAAALGVLKEFYAKASQATAFVQAPEVFGDEPYKGMGGSSGGVVGMMEVIASDFARLEAETGAAEAAAAKEFKDLMNDSKLDKTQKTKDIEHKTESKMDQERALQEKKSDLAGTEKELTAALDYYEKLKPTCVTGGEVSFEDREAQRKEEIESLQEALRILNGEEIA